jgi:hypothetical protein
MLVLSTWKSRRVLHLGSILVTAKIAILLRRSGAYVPAWSFVVAPLDRIRADPRVFSAYTTPCVSGKWSSRYTTQKTPRSPYTSDAWFTSSTSTAWSTVTRVFPVPQRSYWPTGSRRGGANFQLNNWPPWQCGGQLFHRTTASCDNYTRTTVSSYKTMGQCCSAPVLVVKPIPFHVVRKGCYSINYPDHPPRKESALYRRTRRELCQHRDLGCWLCGRNRKAGALTETHHYFVEWAGAPAIEWIKFGSLAQHWYHPQTGQCLGSAFNWRAVAEQPELFLDSPANMLVLCQEHHRGRLGIHHIPFPEWVLQAAPAPGFKFLV